MTAQIYIAFNISAIGEYFCHEVVELFIYCHDDFDCFSCTRLYCYEVVSVVCGVSHHVVQAYVMRSCNIGCSIALVNPFIA